MSIKQERDSDIKRIFTKHNFGPVPEFPFTNDVAMNLTNRIKARLSDLENDLQEKKVSFLIFAIASDVYIYQIVLKIKISMELGHIVSLLYSASFLVCSFISFHSSSQWLDA
jgi:hypothetical protein